MESENRTHQNGNNVGQPNSIVHFEFLNQATCLDDRIVLKVNEKLSVAMDVIATPIEPATKSTTTVSSMPATQLECSFSGCRRVGCDEMHHRTVAKLSYVPMISHVTTLPVLTSSPSLESGQQQRPQSYLMLGMDKSRVYDKTSLHSYSTNPPPFEIGKKRKASRHMRNIKRPVKDMRINLLRCLCRNVVNVGVHVLQNCLISTEESLVLSLGANFVPSPRKRKLSLLSEAMADYTRRVRIKKHFADIQLTDTIDNSVESLLHCRVNKSLSVEEAKANFTPNVTKSPIESYLQKATLDVLAEGTREPKVSFRERKMWSVFYDVTSKLKARKDIVIYPADKNLGITVMNRAWYSNIATSKEYLGDPNTYVKLSAPPQILPMIKGLEDICEEQTWLTEYKLARLYKDLISDHTRDRVKLCRMYFMPKLHKPTLSLRPICASINWITYWTSVYIHLLIFPLLKLIPSYITNSAQLVMLLDQINPPKYFQFIEADVDNLYPTIDIDEGMEAMYIFLTSRSKFHKSQIDFIIKLLGWVLKNNYVSFGDDTYLQISGTAMGTPCAVVFACVYMHILEQEALDIFAYQRYMIRSVFLFVRFIDDLIAIVSDYDSGMYLMELLNSRRKTTKLTFKIRNLEAQFLDLTLYKTKAHTLGVRAYSKPMNKFLFLPPTSCHPRHVFNGWIVGYGRRLRLNCTDDVDYSYNVTAFEDRLRHRGYPDSMITKALSAIPDRESIITTIKKQNANSTNNKTSSIGIPFVVTYSPGISKAIPMLKQALAYTETAQLDPHFPVIFGATTTPLLSFKRGRNVRDLVTSSSFRK